MAVFISPRRDQPLTVQGVGTVRFLEYLENNSDANNTFREEIDLINAILTQVLIDIAQLQADVEALKNKIVVTAVGVTTSGNQTTICTNTTPINITLDLSPELGDEANIKRTNASVAVIGTIDGFTNKTINVKFFSLRLIYNGTDWSQI